MTSGQLAETLIGAMAHGLLSGVEMLLYTLFVTTVWGWALLGLLFVSALFNVVRRAHRP